MSLAIEEAGDTGHGSTNTNGKESIRISENMSHANVWERPKIGTLDSNKKHGKQKISDTAHTPGSTPSSVVVCRLLLKRTKYMLPNGKAVLKRAAAKIGSSSLIFSRQVRQR